MAWHLFSLQEAVRLRPDYADAYTGMGVVLKELKRKIEAEQCFETVVQLRPHCALSLGNLAGEAVALDTDCGTAITMLVGSGRPQRVSKQQKAHTELCRLAPVCLLCKRLKPCCVDTVLVSVNRLLYSAPPHAQLTASTMSMCVCRHLL